MIRTTVNIHEVVERLNKLVDQDPDGMKAICEARSLVSGSLAEEPDLPVMVLKEEDRTRYLLGPLGLLNYLFGMDHDSGMGPVAGIFEVACSRCGLLGGEDEPVGGRCLACGGPLELGDLLEFAITPQGLTALQAGD